MIRESGVGPTVEMAGEGVGSASIEGGRSH